MKPVLHASIYLSEIPQDTLHRSSETIIRNCHRTAETETISDKSSAWIATMWSDWKTKELQCLIVNLLCKCQECMQNNRAFLTSAAIMVSLILMCLASRSVSSASSLNFCRLTWKPRSSSSSSLCNSLHVQRHSEEWHGW